MGKEYAPWSEARPTISHVAKEPELTLLWEELNSHAFFKGESGGISGDAPKKNPPQSPFEKRGG